MSDLYEEEIKNLKFTKEALKAVEKLTGNLLKDLETSVKNHKSLQGSTTQLIENANNMTIDQQQQQQ